MKISDEAEELLETLWTLIEKEKERHTNLKTLEKTEGDASIQELVKSGFINISNEYVILTDEGLKEAEKTARRHRLAERLLVDVLDVKEGLIEETACKFEHLLHEGIEENICTLLGHPTICPHGLPIPPGRCCLENKIRAEKIVFPLSDLKPGQAGKIAYILTQVKKRLQKLMAMGILPGKSVVLIQNFPSYVFQVEQTQIATDEEIANSIYVRLSKPS